MFSQTVLLKGINDQVSILQELFESLFLNGINPYYLYHCDPIYEIKHFRNPLQEGIDIYKELQQLVSGLVLPKYILELPDGYGKIIIDLGFLQKKEGNDYYFLNKGNLVKYTDRF